MAKKGKYTYDWPRPMVTVDALLFSCCCGQKVEVLLIKRGNAPFKGLWAIPGGFVELDEELKDGAARELKEETGISNVDLNQLHTFGTIGRDPRGRQITIVFIALIDKSRHSVQAGDDADQAKWFDVECLPELAFDHSEVIELGLKRLKE